MSREYYRVQPTFWTGETGRLLREQPFEVRLLAVYLMTSPHANALGLYPLPIPYIVHDLKWSSQGATKGLASLAEAYFAAYDEPSETVWVPSMARYQVGESLVEKDKRHGWLLGELMRLAKHPFFKFFVARYHEVYLLPCVPDAEALASPWGGAPVDPPMPRSGSGSGTREGSQKVSPADIKAVFAHWVLAMGKTAGTKLDDNRKGVIRARLSDGFTVEQLCEAIDGCRRDAWHMGDNPQGKAYNDITLICRNAAKLESFLPGGTPQRSNGHEPSVGDLFGQVAAGRAANAKRLEVPAT